MFDFWNFKISKETQTGQELMREAKMTKKKKKVRGYLRIRINRVATNLPESRRTTKSIGVHNQICV